MSASDHDRATTFAQDQICRVIVKRNQITLDCERCSAIQRPQHVKYTGRCAPVIFDKEIGAVRVKAAGGLTFTPQAFLQNCAFEL